MVSFPQRINKSRAQSILKKKKSRAQSSEYDKKKCWTVTLSAKPAYLPIICNLGVIAKTNLNYIQ